MKCLAFIFVLCFTYVDILNAQSSDTTLLPSTTEAADCSNVVLSPPAEVIAFSSTGTPNIINFIWEPPIENSECVDHYLYTIYDEQHGLYHEGTTNDTQLDLHGLSGCWSYPFSVRAVSADGSLGMSTENVTTMAYPNMYESNIFGLEVLGSGDISIVTIVWPQPNCTQAIGVTYNVSWANLLGPDVICSNYTCDTSSCSETCENLVACDTYDWSVQPIYDVDVGEVEPYVWFGYSPGTARPNAVSKLLVGVVSSSSLRLIWSPPDISDNFCGILGYGGYCNPGEATPGSDAVYFNTTYYDFTYEVEGLQGSTEYYCGVSAVNEYGVGPVVVGTATTN